MRRRWTILLTIMAAVAAATRWMRHRHPDTTDHPTLAA